MLKIGDIFEFDNRLYCVAVVNEARALCVLYDVIKNKKEVRNVRNYPPSYLISISPNSEVKVKKSVNIKFLDN